MDPAQLERKREHDRSPEARARQRERYHAMSGVAYNRLLLRMRRTHALRRMEARNERRRLGQIPA